MHGELVWYDTGCQDHQSQEPEREGAVTIECCIWNRAHAQQWYWDACCPRQSNGWLLLSLLSTIKDHNLKNRYSSTVQRMWARGNSSASLCLFCVGSSEIDVREVRCLSIALWLHFHLRHSKSSEPTKSPPNTQPNPLLAHVAVCDRPWQNWQILSVFLPACLPVCVSVFPSKLHIVACERIRACDPFSIYPQQNLTLICHEKVLRRES